MLKMQYKILLLKIIANTETNNLSLIFLMAILPFLMNGGQTSLFR